LTESARREFGRSPDNGIRRGDTVWGRDHNPAAMSMWFAGRGVRAGHILEAADEIGQMAVEVARPMRDVHVTILSLLGLDDAKLTYFHAGSFRQLSQFGGSGYPSSALSCMAVYWNRARGPTIHLGSGS
jgi:hypothetical protein